MQSFWTLVFAGIGAFIASLVAKLVEAWVRRSQTTETQRDSDLQDLIAAAKLFGELAEKFWPKSATDLGEQDQILQAHMKAQQHNISQLVDSLLTGKNKWNCDTQSVKLFNVATGGQFGEPDRPAEPQRLSGILIEMHALVHEAKAARRQIKRGFLF